MVLLESDLGEGFGAWAFGDDEALLDIVTGANIACGFHGGDPMIIRRTCRAAVDRGVAIGAHVSYRDLAGFGRRRVEVPPADLVDEILYQLGALNTLSRSVGGHVSYLKAHGALYNTAALDPDAAGAIVEAVTLFNPGLPIVCQAGTVMERLARDAGLATLSEIFADRAYQTNGLLVPRSQPGAVITDPAEAATRAVRAVTELRITSIDKTVEVHLPEPVAAICVHSDTPGAALIASAVRTALEDAGVSLRGL
jgi:UPF0271 protein